MIEWNQDELQQIDRKTRKLLTIYKAHHPQADVDRLYWKRSGGRGLLSVEECEKIEKSNIEQYVSQSEEKLLQVANEESMERGNVEMCTKKEMVKQRKKKFNVKRLHGQFWKATDKERDPKRWEWLKKGKLKKETEGTILAAQDQVLRTNAIKHHIDKSKKSPKCRMCGQ